MFNISYRKPQRSDSFYIMINFMNKTQELEFGLSKSDFFNQKIFSCDSIHSLGFIIIFLKMNACVTLQILTSSVSAHPVD